MRVVSPPPPPSPDAATPPDTRYPDRQPELAIASHETLRAGEVHPALLHLAPSTPRCVRFLAANAWHRRCSSNSHAHQPHHLRRPHDPLLRIRPVREQVPAGAFARMDSVAGATESRNGPPFHGRTHPRKAESCIRGGEYPAPPLCRGIVTCPRIGT